MPLYEYLCSDCGEISEVLVFNSSEPVSCKRCNSKNVSKVISASSSVSGPARFRMPGPKDTTCCGSSPGESAGCSGPGSCCGKP